MRRVFVALLALALAGCGAASSGGTTGVARHRPTSSHTTVTPATSTTTAPVALPVGPGPQASYEVQPQPAPGSCHYRRYGVYPLPDPHCTPGATSPAVTQANLADTICSPHGYTSRIRPPASITGPEKQANAKSYGYAGSMATGEYDHLVSLELGGDPNDPRNLWVEPNDRPNATGTTNSKDVVENAAHTAVCAGRLSLTAAQTGIATDWVTLGRQLDVIH